MSHPHKVGELRIQVRVDNATWKGPTPKLADLAIATDKALKELGPTFALIVEAHLPMEEHPSGGVIVEAGMPEP